MVSTAVIGAVVGVLIGVVLLAVLITCIIYISKKLEKKTNTRSKIISTDGRVIKDKWAEDEEVKKYYTGDDDRKWRVFRPDATGWYQSRPPAALPRTLIPNSPVFGPSAANYVTNEPGRLSYQRPRRVIPAAVTGTGFNTMPMSGRVIDLPSVHGHGAKAKRSKTTTTRTMTSIRPSTLREVQLPPLGSEPQPILSSRTVPSRNKRARQSRSPRHPSATRRAQAAPQEPIWQTPATYHVPLPTGSTYLEPYHGYNTILEASTSPLQGHSYAATLPGPFHVNYEMLSNQGDLFHPDLRNNIPPKITDRLAPGLRTDAPLNMLNELPRNPEVGLPSNVGDERFVKQRSISSSREMSHNFSSEMSSASRNDSPFGIRSLKHSRDRSSQVEPGRPPAVGVQSGAILPETGQMTADAGNSNGLGENSLKAKSVSFNPVPRRMGSSSTYTMSGVEDADYRGSRLYFGHIDKTEHVEVKEKRRREDIYIPPEPAPPQPPPAVAPIVEPPPPVIPVPSPKPHPRLARYRFRSWPKRQRESQTVTRRASIGHAEGVKYFVYGVPYPVNSAPEPTPPAPVAPPQVTPPQVTPPQVTPSAPPVPLVATIENVSPPRKCRSIEEQERVMVIDDTVTEKSFNPRWKADASAYVSDHTTTDVVQTTSISCSCEQQSNRAVPRIVTELL